MFFLFPAVLFANWFVRMSESFPQNWQKLGNFQSSDSADVILPKFCTCLPKCLQMFTGEENKHSRLTLDF